MQQFSFIFFVAATAVCMCVVVYINLKRELHACQYHVYLVSDNLLILPLTTNCGGKNDGGVKCENNLSVESVMNTTNGITSTSIAAPIVTR